MPFRWRDDPYNDPIAHIVDINTAIANAVFTESQVTNLPADLASLNAAVALRALDTLVVHLGGTESITGQKSFSQTILANAAVPIKLPTGILGQVLTSDASGNLTLATPTSAKATITIGDGVSTTFTIIHNLNVSPVWAIEVVCYSTTAGPNQQIVPDIGNFTANQVTLIFASPPATNSVNVKVSA